MTEAIVPTERIEQSILVLRGQKVMLDADLAEVYGVETRSLVQAIKRNAARFPQDFMFQLSEAEFAFLRSQNVISNVGRGGRRYPPYAFTEHGAVMLASVLNSPVAVQASVAVVRAFIRLREVLSTHKDLAARLDALERKMTEHDAQFKAVFDAIRALMTPPTQPKRKQQIGFVKTGDKT